MKKMLNIFTAILMLLAMTSYASAMCGHCDKEGHEATHKHAAGETDATCSTCAAEKDKAASDAAVATTEEAAPVAEATAAK